MAACAAAARRLNEPVIVALAARRLDLALAVREVGPVERLYDFARLCLFALACVPQHARQKKTVK